MLAGAVVCGAFGCGAPTVAWAQHHPAAAVRVVLPFASGGSADMLGRCIAQRLRDALGQRVVVDQRPGGGPVVGSDAVAKALPDGNTLRLMSNTHSINESPMPNKPLQPLRDLVSVAPIHTTDLVLVAKTKLPVKTLAALVAHAS